MPEIASFAVRLKQGLHRIEATMMELLDISSIQEIRNDPDSIVVFIGPSFYWGDTDERQKILQMELVRDYSIWIEQFRLLFGKASQEIKKQIDETHEFVTSWIEKESSWSIPATIPEAKDLFREKVQVLYQLLDLLEKPGTHELILVPDTNSLIAAPDFEQYVDISGQSQFTILIVPTVLGELDTLKVVHREQEFRDKVNSVIRRIKGLRTQGSLLTGVTVNKTITVKMRAAEPNFGETLEWLDSENKDDRIVASVLELQRENPSSIIVLVTSDINLQNKAEMANLPFLEPPR